MFADVVVVGVLPIEVRVALVPVDTAPPPPPPRAPASAPPPAAADTSAGTNAAPDDAAVPAAAFAEILKSQSWMLNILDTFH